MRGWMRERILASATAPPSRSDGYSLDSEVVGSKKRPMPFRDRTCVGTSRDGSQDNAGKFSRPKRRLWVLKASSCSHRFMKDAMQLQAARIRRCFLTLSRTEFGIPSSEKGSARKRSVFFQMAYVRRSDSIVKHYGHKFLFNQLQFFKRRPNHGSI